MFNFEELLLLHELIDERLDEIAEHLEKGTAIFEEEGIGKDELEYMLEQERAACGEILKKINVALEEIEEED